MDVRRQEQKNKTLMQRCVQYVSDNWRGSPIPGVVIADNVKVLAAQAGQPTTGEVLAKELRRAARKGILRRSKSLQGLVQYSPGSASKPNPPRAGSAPPGKSSTTTDGQTLLLDSRDLFRPHHRGA